jgi:hypothetical protein
MQRASGEELEKDDTERVDVGSARACSGDMYAVLPFKTPGSSRNRFAEAMPKSAIFTAPSNDSRMF